MHFVSKKEIQKRHPEIDEKELEKRAESIGMGAIKFFVLKFDAMKDFVFNPKESLSFEGETGPYVQYTYARISSILRKYGKEVTEEINFNNLGYVYQYEIALDVLRFLPRLDNILAENIISQPPLPRFRINYSNSLMIHKFNSLIENGHENIAINHIEIIDEITEILHVGREDELFNNLAILGGDSKYQQIILSFIFEKISKIMNSKILGYRKDYFIFKL